MATHTCTVCHTQGPWSATWSWFGSYKDLDTNGTVPKFCADVCRDQWAADNAEYLVRAGVAKPTTKRRGQW